MFKYYTVCKFTIFFGISLHQRQKMHYSFFVSLSPVAATYSPSASVALAVPV